jgi:guanylate kinase
MSKSKSKIFVLSAASGVGKSTLIRKLLETHPQLVFSISATTRAPRTGEVEGRHYFFKTRDQFETMIADGELAEYQEVHGNYYGTPKSFIDTTLEKGHSVVMDIDVVGKTKFDKVYPHAVGIFIETPSMDILESRLRSRQTDSEETIQTRLKNAAQEIDYARTTGKFEYTLVNDDLETAYRELETIVHQELGI